MVSGDCERPLFESETKVPPVCQASGYKFVHEVRPGECLSRIAEEYYRPIGNAALQEVVGQIVRDNPGIDNPNLLHPGEGLLLRMPFQIVFPTPDELEDLLEVNRIARTMHPEEKELVSRYPDLLESLALLATGASASALGFAAALEQANGPIKQIIESYLKFKKGGKTKSAHYALRKAKLAEYNKKAGQVFHKIVYGDKTSSQAFRVNPKVGRNINRILASTKNIAPGARPLSKQLSKMAKATSKLRGAGWMLFFAGLGISAYSVYDAWDTKDRVKVFAEETVGTISAAVVGWSLTAVLVTSAAGTLGVGIIVGAGAMGAYYGGSEFAEWVYENGYLKHLETLFTKRLD